jgi:hypothetical protein
MQINFAHLQERSTSGGSVNFAVFEAKSSSSTDLGKKNLLSQLTSKARAAGLRVDQSAIAFMQNGHIQFYGDKNLVDYLSCSGVPRWTHKIDV